MSTKPVARKQAKQARPHKIKEGKANEPVACIQQEAKQFGPQKMKKEKAIELVERGQAEQLVPRR